MKHYAYLPYTSGVPSEGVHVEMQQDREEQMVNEEIREERKEVVVKPLGRLSLIGLHIVG